VISSLVRSFLDRPKGPANKRTAAGAHLDAPGEPVHAHHLAGRIDEGNEDALWREIGHVLGKHNVGTVKPIRNPARAFRLSEFDPAELRVVEVTPRLLVVMYAATVVAVAALRDDGELIVDAHEDLADMADLWPGVVSV